MRIFLIDFENVHSEGMTGVDHLTDTDEVVIFYSSNADSISFDILHKLMFCKSKLNYYKIKRGGKNALDFQLSCYLGYRISKNQDAEFYIISKDSGYDFIIDFWECGYINSEPKIRRFNTIKTLLQWTEAQKKQKDKAAKAVQNLIKNVKNENAVLEKPENAEITLTQSKSEEVLHTQSENAVIVPTNPKNGVVISSDIKTNQVKDINHVDAEPIILKPEESNALAALIANCKNTHEFYTSTVKHFGQKKGLEIYRNFKSDYATEFKRRKEAINNKPDA